MDYFTMCSVTSPLPPPIIKIFIELPIICSGSCLWVNFIMSSGNRVKGIQRIENVN